MPPVMLWIGITGLTLGIVSLFEIKKKVDEKPETKSETENTKEVENDES